MKKILITLAATAMLASSAFAHHMSANDDAGVNIPLTSPHLLMTF